MQVATVGTFSAAWLEGLRMMLATLEGGDGEISMPTSFDRGALLAGLGLMLPAVLAATAAGAALQGLIEAKRCWWISLCRAQDESANAQANASCGCKAS